MRNAFLNALTELAERDRRIVLLTGDLGFTVLEPFAERFPDRFFNVGVAEQNMVGLAVGLAETGLIPFAYSIATFATMRPYEFIRNGPVLHRLPVRIVGVGGGFDYGHNGATHYALEDVGLMRLQQGLTCVVPADDAQACAALLATYDSERPVYYRIAKAGPAVPGLDGAFTPGRLQILQEGSDVCLVAMGPIVGEALGARDLLERDGLSVGVAVVSSFNPSPDEDLAEFLSRAPLAVTVESHFRGGGLGSFAAETIADRGLPVRLQRCGVAGLPRGCTGSQRFLENLHEISADAVAGSVLATLGTLR